MEETKSYKPGDKFLCKRYFNAKRTVYVPCEALRIGEDTILLRDIENNSEFRVNKYGLKEIKPLTEEWVMNKVKKLSEEKNKIEFQIRNLFSIWANI